MNNTIQIFENSEFGKLEVIMIDGKPYFPAGECARILGYNKPNDAVNRHCRSTMKCGRPHPQSPDKVIEANFIPEGDLYRLIFRSKLPAAVRFEAWVCDIVLPSVRKHGAYVNEEILRRMQEDNEFADGLIRRLAAENHVLIDKMSRLTPKARYCDIVLRCPEAVQVSIISKDYGMSATAFNKLLHKLGVQFRMGKTWLLYAKYQGNGYTITNTYTRNGMVTLVHTCFTQRGRLFLYNLLKSHGILPEVEKMAQHEQMTFEEAGA